MKDLCYIYSLCCPITHEVRYIGKSCNPNRRFRSHVSSRPPKTHKECWIAGLRKKGLLPVLIVEDAVKTDEVNFWESYYIFLYKSWGFDLTNKTFGGDGAQAITLEVRQKISDSLKNKKQSAYTKDKRSKSLTEAWKNPELRELKKNQTLDAHKRGCYIGKYKKGYKLSVVRDKERLSKALTVFWSDNDRRHTEAINKGSKPFGAYKIKEIKRGNRWGKGYVITGDLIKGYDCNYSKAARDFGIEVNHIRRILKGKLLSENNITFKYHEAV